MGTLLSTSNQPQPDSSHRAIGDLLGNYFPGGNLSFDTQQLKKGSGNDPIVLAVIDLIKARFSNDNIFDPMTEYLFTGLYGAVGITGFFSTLFVLIVIISSQRLLRNPSNFLLLNLMISNLVMSVTCIPFTLVTVIRESWPFGSIMCKLIPTFQNSSVITSSVTIGIISFDRLLRVTNDSPTHDFRSTRAKSHWIQISIETIIIWISSYIISIPVWLNQTETVLGVPEIASITKCLESWKPHLRITYTMIVMLIQLIVPSTILFISHFKIKQHLDQKLVKLDGDSNNSSSGDDDGSDDDEPDTSHGADRPCNSVTIALGPTLHSSYAHLSSSNNTDVAETNQLTSTRSLIAHQADKQRKRLLKKELDRNRRVTSFLAILTISFVLSWLPLNLLNIYIDLNPDTKLSLRSINILTAVFHLISMTSIPVNSFLYGFLNTNVRPEAKKLIMPIMKSFKELFF